jgi:RecA/RadA recombinase
VRESDAVDDILVLRPGRVTALVGPPGFGLTRLALALLGEAQVSGPVACLDVRGWLCPSAAWESGIGIDQLVLARCSDPVSWAKTAATLIEGVGAVYAEVPRGIKDAQLRKLGALVRSR